MTNTTILTNLSKAALLAALCLSPLSTNAATLSVDCDAGNTITAALASVKPGDTVLVSGTCKEQVSVAPEIVRITLDGQKKTTVHHPGGQAASVHAVYIRGKEITIKGFTVTGGQANPGKVNWASAGVNSTPHVSMAIFTAATGVELTHVPYKGAALALIDIVSGQVAGMHTSVASAEAQIRSNRVRVIAVAGPKRVPMLPDAPTLAEAGIDNAEAPNFYGMAAPARTPPAIVQKLNAGVNEALAQPEVRRRLSDLGMDIVGGSPEDATKFVMTQAARVRGLIRAGVLTPE